MYVLLEGAAGQTQDIGRVSVSQLRNASLSPWLEEEVTETLLVEGEVTTWMLTGLKHPSVKSFRTVS